MCELPRSHLYGDGHFDQPVPAFTVIQSGCERIRNHQPEHFRPGEDKKPVTVHTLIKITVTFTDGQTWNRNPGIEDMCLKLLGISTNENHSWSRCTLLQNRHMHDSFKLGSPWGINGLTVSWNPQAPKAPPNRRRARLRNPGAARPRPRGRPCGSQTSGSGPPEPSCGGR